MIRYTHTIYVFKKHYTYSKAICEIIMKPILVREHIRANTFYIRCRNYLNEYQ